MSGPSTSASSSSTAKRAKSAAEKKSKGGKKSDSEILPGPSSSMMSRMISSGNTDDKIFTLEERTALGVRHLLNEMNIKADESSMEMLGELTRTLCSNVLSEARTVAIHADRTDVQPDDINYAAKKYNIKQQSRMERAELAKVINSQELPKLRGSGLHLPVDRYCITQPTFQTAVAFKMQDNTEPQSQAVSTSQQKQGMGSTQVTSMLKSQEDAYD
uniref:Transcription initiation factor TFIID subunit 12 n=1 Tax=Panagrolaimus superbus TaxID=310955 RepID=A0A914XY00_9BILA